MSTLELAKDEDYKNLERLFEVEHQMINAINELLPLYPLEHRDRSMLGRELSLLQTFMFAREIDRSIWSLSGVMSQISCGVLVASEMRTYLSNRAHSTEHWIGSRLKY